MTHLDTELHYLKEDLIKMTRMVRSQISKGKNSIFDFDKDLAKEILFTEKRINAFELKIDRDCEKIFALYNPLAADLRFVLAALKINSNLERIADNAESVAHYVMDVKTPFSVEVLEKYNLTKMYEVALAMLDDSLDALINEDTELARKVFIKDDILDEINLAAIKTTLALIENNHPDPLHYLSVLSVIRKIERMGDQSKNIAEEIIFYIEAKVLKHRT
ncbi:MAG: phosphate signaling complex protein PhoU [Bacteroidetes bacterium]|nr:phosphate signaling complex protein PhoU [Bacteroidota bacterium]HET6243791.1 phosphate signaling complex protein PhoU [Bacteroidia bacterium]